MLSTMDMPMPCNCSMDISMYFHIGYQPYILLKQWSAQSYASMLGTCIFFAIIAIFYELLKYYRHNHAISSECRVCGTDIAETVNVNADSVAESSHQSSPIFYSETCRIETDKTEDRIRNIGAHRTKRRALMLISNVHLIQTALHMILLFLSYLLMLGFMTFNVWICVSIIIGGGLGYFLVGWKKSYVRNDDHCHI